MSEYKIDAIGSVQRWVKQVVIRENFCPFAKPVDSNNVIRYQVTQDDTIEKALLTLIDECAYLTDHEQWDTSLLIFDNGFQLFSDFVELIYLADALLIEQGYEGVFQLAHFHPQYCFDGCDEQSAENFTNRSPLPVLHLLREQSVESALQSINLPENIPNRNIRHARKKGYDYWRKKLSNCIQNK